MKDQAGTPGSGPEDSRHGSTRTVDRALALLVEVALNDGLPLGELARRASLAPATALRLLRTLEAATFIERDGSGSYHGGGRLIEIALNMMSRSPLYRAADPHLAALRDETGESAYLGVHGPGNTVIYARLAETDRAVRHQGWLGKSVPLEGTAIGTALQAGCGPKGYYSTTHTMEEGVTAIASTIYWPDGSVAAAISVVGPSYRISKASADAYGEAVARHARELTQYLRSGSHESQPAARTAR